MPPLPAHDTAHRLLAREAATGPTTPDDPAGAQRAVRRLADELAVWFGPHGARALLTRALVSAQVTHPALAAVRVGLAPGPDLDGLADSTRAHGAAAVAAATGDVLVALVDLLGRVIGDELAATLAEQSMGPLVRPAAARGEGRGEGRGSGTAGGGVAGDAPAALGDTTGSTQDD